MSDLDFHPIRELHPEVEVGAEPTRVMCEMVGAVDERMLGEQVRRVPSSVGGT